MPKIFNIQAESIKYQGDYELFGILEITSLGANRLLASLPQPYPGVCTLGHAWLVPTGMYPVVASSPRVIMPGTCHFLYTVAAWQHSVRYSGGPFFFNVHGARIWKIQRAHTRVRIRHTTVCLPVAIVMLWGGASAPPAPLTRWSWTPPDFP